MLKQVGCGATTAPLVEVVAEYVVDGEKGYNGCTAQYLHRKGARPE